MASTRRVIANAFTVWMQLFYRTSEMKQLLLERSLSKVNEFL